MKIDNLILSKISIYFNQYVKIFKFIKYFQRGTLYIWKYNNNTSMTRVWAIWEFDERN